MKGIYYILGSLERTNHLVLAYIICNKVICILKTNLLDDPMHKFMFITPFFSCFLFSFFINLTYIRESLRRARTPCVMASRMHQQRRQAVWIFFFDRI
jgi:hypothetical protein